MAEAGSKRNWSSLNTVNITAKTDDRELQKRFKTGERIPASLNRTSLPVKDQIADLLTIHKAHAEGKNVVGKGKETESQETPVTAMVPSRTDPLPNKSANFGVSLAGQQDYGSGGILFTSSPTTVWRSSQESFPEKPLKVKEGLEESTIRIIRILQTSILFSWGPRVIFLTRISPDGKMLFKDIHETLNINYRRVYDILNVLLTTPLVKKLGKKRDKLPYYFGDGVSIPEPVDINDILTTIQEEESAIREQESRIEVLEKELERESEEKE